MKKILSVILLFLICMVCFGEDFFPISVWKTPTLLTEARVKEMKECGINVFPVGYDEIEQNPKIMDWIKNADMNFLIFSENFKSKDENIAEKTIDFCKSQPNFWGYLIADEPGYGAFDELKEYYNRVRKYDSDHPILIDLLGDATWWAMEGQNFYEGHLNYDAYVRTFNDKVKPNFMSYDEYIFKEDGNDMVNYWFGSLITNRKYAKRDNIPFNTILLSCPHYLASNPGGGYRDLTEGELRWEVYTALAFGCRGIHYFTYYTPNRDQEEIDNNTGFIYDKALLNRDYSRNPKWYYVQSINSEIHKMANILINAKSENVYFNGDNIPPLCMPIPENYLIKNAKGDLVIGELSVKDNKYFMIVNRDYKKETFAEITFANSVRAEEINPRGNKPIITEKTFSKLLPPGDGVLIKVK